MNNKLLRYGAKDHFFRAALCRMCIDVQDASNSLNRYEEMFPIFADSRECKLLKVGNLISMCMQYALWQVLISESTKVIFKQACLYLFCLIG